MRFTKKMLRIVLALILLPFVNCFGSSEESKDKYSNEKVLSGVARDAHMIIRGKVIKHKITYHIDKKEVSLEEGRKSNSGETTRIYAKTTATIKIELVLKGPVGGEEITLSWQDPFRTDCPHIPMREYFTDGIWFTINRLDKAGKSHHIDWMHPALQEKLETAIQRRAELVSD